MACRRSTSRSLATRSTLTLAGSNRALAFSLFAGAHIGEIMRGALASVPRADRRCEGDRAHLLAPPALYPAAQAIPVIIPPWTNTAAELVKGTSLVTLVSMSDLLFATRKIAERTGDVIPLYVAAAIIYFVICFSISRAGVWLSGRYRYGVAPNQGNVISSATAVAPGIATRRWCVSPACTSTSGDLHVSARVDLDVVPGEVVCIIGPSGPARPLCSAASTSSRRISRADLVDGQLSGYRERSATALSRPENEISRASGAADRDGLPAASTSSRT